MHIMLSSDRAVLSSRTMEEENGCLKNGCGGGNVDQTI